MGVKTLSRTVLGTQQGDFHVFAIKKWLKLVRVCRNPKLSQKEIIVINFIRNHAVFRTRVFISKTKISLISTALFLKAGIGCWVSNTINR